MAAVPTAITSYQPKTAPFDHQREAFEQSAMKRVFAYRMSPGLGKTKVTLDVAALLFEHGHINAVLVAAPNDVHAQWAIEQIPEHLPERIKRRCLIWKASRSKSRREIEEVCKHPPANTLVFLLMNHEAFATKKGKAYAKKFLEKFRCMFVLDDSHEFRSPKAQRTRAVISLAPLAKIRRILTGTLTGGKPFAVYSQFRFLDERILGQDSYLAFKHEYGVFQKRTVTKYGPNGVKRRIEFEELESYRNLDKLTQLMHPYMYSKEKKDCVGLPPKLPQTVPTHLSPAQRALYRQLSDEGIALLEAAEHGRPVQLKEMGLLTDEELAEAVSSSANRITFKIKLTLLLRLQQVAAGIVNDDSGRAHLIDGKWYECPRLRDAVNYVRQTIESTNTKVLVWANFRPILEILHEAFEAFQTGEPELTYYGSTLIHGDIRGEERANRIKEFKNPESATKILVAHPRTMGTGQNFEVASTVLFVTRSFSLFQRIQAEDRAHRLSSQGTVTIADMVAANCPTDKKEMALLRDKQNMMDRIESLDSRAFREMLTESEEEA